MYDSVSMYVFVGCFYLFVEIGLCAILQELNAGIALACMIRIRIYDGDGRKESRFKCYDADSNAATAKLFDGHLSKNLPLGALFNPEMV